MHAIGLSFLIVSIIIVRQCMKGRIHHWVQYALWVVIPLYLMTRPFVNIPVELPIHMMKAPLMEISGSTLVSDATNNNTTVLHLTAQNHTGSDAAIASQKADLDTDQDNEANHETELPVRLQSVARIIYICGCVMFLLIVLMRNIRFANLCRKNGQYLGRDRETGMRIYLVDAICSPFLLGTRVYLPKDIIKNHTMRRHAVLHEYCHCCQGDSVWPLVRHGILILNWYNPLAWMAFYLCERDGELACDEAVIEILGDPERVRYGETLLRMEEVIDRYPGRLSLSTQMGRRGRAMRERILSIRNGNSNSIPLAILAGAVVVLTAGCAMASPAAEGSVGAVTSESVTDDTATVAVIQEDAAISEPRSTYAYVPGDTQGGVLFIDGKAYYGDDIGMHQVDLSTGTDVTLEDVGCRIGNIDNNWIYYYRNIQTNTPESDSGIYRMNIGTGESQELLANDHTSAWNPWNLGSFCGEGNYLYLNLLNMDDGSGLIAYQIAEDGTVEQTDDSPLGKQLNALDIMTTQEELSDLCGNWISTLVHHHKAVVRYGDPGDYSVEICDSDGGDIIAIDGVWGNIYPTYQGLVYTTTDYDIHLLPWDESLDADWVIYDAYAEGFYINYGCGDEDGIYGVREDQDEAAFYRIGFDGTVLQLCDASILMQDSTMFGISSGLCGGDGWYGYYDAVNEEMVISRVTE